VGNDKDKEAVMRIRVLIIFLVAFLSTSYFLLSTSYFLLPTSSSYASGGCGENCQKCHTLNNNEVQEILKKIKRPDAKILNIQMSPVKGLWEVAVEDKGQRGVFYVDFSKKYILGGQIIEVNVAIDRTRQKLNELNKNRRIDRSRIPLGDALLLGDKNATKKVIVFTDPDCPFCGKLHDEMKKVVTKRKDIAFYIKLFPLKIHPDAYWKSKSILCNKSLKLLEDNFEKKPIPQPNCEAKEIDENIKLGETLGISGTPTSIMPDGSVHIGFLSADKLIERIDSSTKVKKKGAGK
jgi:thiol:disulfide interchange protein DsbC